MDIKTLGIDLAKNVFQVHGVDSFGKTRLPRAARLSVALTSLGEQSVANLRPQSPLTPRCQLELARFSRRWGTAKISRC
jgi:hypothetical protein